MYQLLHPTYLGMVVPRAEGLWQRGACGRARFYGSGLSEMLRERNEKKVG